MAPKNPKQSIQSAKVEDKPSVNHWIRRHLLFGWSCLIVFVGFGLVLESLHAFKSTSYLGVDSETRRLMWTLAHSHGTLISLVQIAFAASLGHLNVTRVGLVRLASNSLIASNILMPVGFFLGGMQYYSNDPGLGVLLVPPGGVFLVVSVIATAWIVRQSPVK